eukprot:jgi/Psemu1/60429/gm1.60429_g
MNTQFQPCIQYERTFDITEDHDSHKLIVDYAKAANRLAGKKNIRIVQDLDVEEILHTYDIFVDACDDLGMPVERWHTQWGQCLSRGPRKRWNKIIADREIDHSREGFKTTVQAYINAIIPDPDAKGTMIEAFEHYHMAKPKEVSERAHFNRIDTILDNIDMLPGDNDHDLTEQQRKRMLFKTHPKSWQDSYMDTAVNFREVTILQIRDYMTRRKDRADRTEKGKNNRTPSTTSRERENDKRKDIQQGNNESKREVVRRDDCFERCKRHPNGNHTWEQCYFNPKNRQHAPYPQYTSSNNSYSGNSNPNRRFSGQFGDQGSDAGARRGPNQNDYGGRSGGRGNGAGAGRGPVCNESNYNQWWGQNDSNYHADAYSNITTSEASYPATQGQDQNLYQYQYE